MWAMRVLQRFACVSAPLFGLCVSEKYSSPARVCVYVCVFVSFFQEAVFKVYSVRYWMATV